MKSSTLIASLLSVCLVGVAVGADTLRVDFVETSTGPYTTQGGGNDLVEYEIVGTLQTGDSVSQGLAFFAFDMSIVHLDGEFKINLETTASNNSTEDTANFEAPDGYSDVFGGTPSGNDLIQGGGGLNTIGNTIDFEPFPIGPVDLGVAFPPGGAVLMSGSLFLPPGMEPDGLGTYELSIIPGSLFANVITLDPPVGEPPVYTVETADVLIGDPLIFEVAVVCDDAIAPALVHLVSPTGVAFDDHAFSGFIDPRRESSDGVNIDLGIGPNNPPGQIPVTMVFDEPVFDLGSTNGGTQEGVLTIAGFTVEETGAGPAPNVVAITTADNITVTIELHRVITPQEWTTVIALVEDECGNPIESNDNEGPGFNEPDRIDVAFLPGNINQDNRTSSTDLFLFRNCLTNNVCTFVDTVKVDYMDTSRNGFASPADIFFYRQILLGTGDSTKAWFLEAMNNSQP